MTAQDVTIRPARPPDIRPIVSLWKTLQTENAASDPRLATDADAEFWLSEYLRAAVDDDRTALFVAEADEAVVGFISGQIHRRPTLALGNIGYIADLTVAEGWRGRGVGTRLFERLRAWFSAHDITALEVQAVHANPQSQGFWRHLGFDEFLITYRIDP